MNYGFVIDNRSCIGCHACTVACKSEFDVPLGVNRTYVKYLEKGTFPNNQRVFSVHRCNHCEAAPCVEICPTTALYTRSDGIVDFDSDRCIGCKSCMQACPYDALYIDPDTHTAAKCNFCAHRLDGGYEPACVIVCPVEAITSGDLDDPDSKIAQLVAREQVTVRKPEKNTRPNVYYIDGDYAMFNPSQAPPQTDYMSSSQATGVGHFAEKDDKLLINMALEAHRLKGTAPDQRAIDNVLKELEDQSQPAEKRVYDVPGKGILWGWEVAGYLWTKAIAAGTFLVLAAQEWLGWQLLPEVRMAGLGISGGFMLATLGLLVKDLDRPERFVYVLLRPNWSSWLTRGGYIITLFSGVLMLAMFSLWRFGWVPPALTAIGAILAVLTAIYTAFLLAQAKGRDLWQSASGSLQMLTHAIVAGAAVTQIINPLAQPLTAWFLGVGLVVELSILALEIFTPHVTTDTALAIEIMTRGPLWRPFYAAVVGGGLLPLGLIIWGGPAFMLPAAILALLGVLLSAHVWIKAPQMVPLS